MSSMSKRRLFLLKTILKACKKCFIAVFYGYFFFGFLFFFGKNIRSAGSGGSSGSAVCNPVKKKKCKCNLFTHGAPRSSKNSFRNARAFQDRIGIWKCWFLRRGENRSTRRKTSRSRVENQQQTQPTYDAGSGNRTRDTLVGGERSHHYTNPAPLSLVTSPQFSNIR